MFKRRFRLPSPALVISMITLSLVLGGTAFAAATATHKDKKADTKLIKKLAPSLSVKHAKTADSATNATHATSADSATNATNATHATSATSATNATNATTAANANALGGLGPGSYQKVPTTTQYEVVEATALVPTVPGSVTNTIQGGPGGGLQYCANDASNRFYYSLHLPQGATIVSEDADYVDDSGTTGGNGANYVTRTPLWNSGGTYNDIFNNPLNNTATPGDTGTATDTSPNSGTNVVDNTKYAYIIITSPAGAADICGLRIGYTIPSGFAAAAGHHAAAQKPGSGSLRGR